jgi:hypothetical protein
MNDTINPALDDEITTPQHTTQQYTGTKTLFATPMNRADYNVYRGWGLPADEDGTDEGYLVEYTDGGEANHPDHAGYISWSPKEQFDNAYDLSGNALERLKIELEDLTIRIDGLIAYTGTDRHMSLHKNAQRDLRMQLKCMREYSVIMNRRIARWEG